MTSLNYKEPTGFTKLWDTARSVSNLFTKSYPDYKTSEDHDNYGNVTCRDIESSPVADFFFSNKNINHLRKLICDKVRIKSNGMYNLTPESQSKDELVIVMRSIYLTNRKGWPDRINEQICELNKLVLEDLIPRTLSNCQMYTAYMKFKEGNIVPMEHPLWMSSAGTKQNKPMTSIW